MQVVAMDIVGPLPKTKEGCLSVGHNDHFSKWAEAYPIPNQEAITVAQKLVDEFLFSTPEQLHADQDRQFEAGVILEVCKILRIKKTRTTPYHPQGDGLVERLNRTLVDMISAVLKVHPSGWRKG